MNAGKILPISHRGEKFAAENFNPHQPPDIFSYKGAMNSHSIRFQLRFGLRYLVGVFALFAAMSSPALANSRIKDIADFENIRTNQLVGYGLVVGLAGTGD